MGRFQRFNIFSKLKTNFFAFPLLGFVNDNVPRATNGVGMGCWQTAMCGSHLCWSTREESAAPRIDQMIKDGVPEAAMFRIAGDQDKPGHYPEDFWWAELLRFKNS